MPRPKKCRRICAMPPSARFEPAGGSKAEPVVLTVEEFELLRLLDLEQYTQAQCAAQMQVARATVQAVRKQYPGKRLVACMELHTFSSLTGDFLPQYRGCMDGADVAFVYYNPEVVRHKRLQAITPQQVQAAFGGGDRLTVLTDPQELQRRLRQLDMHDTALLFMSSGNFSGIDVAALAQELIKE